MPTPAMEHPDRRLLYSVWAWTDDALLLTRCSDHDGRESEHEVLALATPHSIDVSHRAAFHPHTTHRQLGSFHKPRSITELDDHADGRTAMRWALGSEPLGLTGAIEVALRRAADQPSAPETLMTLDPSTSVADDHLLYHGQVNATLERDRERLTMLRAECLALLSWGVAPFDGQPAPLLRPPDPLPQRLWFRVLLPIGDGVAAAIVEDQSGERVHHAAWGDRAGDLAPPGPLHLEWVPGSRRLARATLAGVPSSGDVITLTPLITLPGSLIGGLGAEWPLGGWIGDDAWGRRHHPMDTPLTGLAGVEFEYLCKVDGIPGATRGIVTLTALGSHAPSGLTGWTDAP